MRLVAALSGGVDSAVAAARAVEAGHDVVGVHLALSRSRAAHREGSRGCCTIEDAHDARRVADILEIPFYVWDLSEAFARDVIEDFVEEYAAGRTPNPCVRCNESIKFAAVLERAQALGFDGIVTGHYAQVLDGPDGPQLHRGIDPTKDQSYVLGVLGPEVLARTVLPLGGSTKEQVRLEAERRGLRVAHKPDSYDICFIPDGDTAAFLRSRLGERPGSVVDPDGTVLGEHSGTYAYTVGQRKGLGLATPASDGRPRYVLDIEPTSGTVTVGPRESLAVREITTAAARWTAKPFDGEAPLHVQWRAHADAVAATVRVRTSGLTIELAEPAFGIAPGQEVVVFEGTRVLLSARIQSAA